MVHPGQDPDSKLKWLIWVDFFYIK
jgi:hypothetical protein